MVYFVLTSLPKYHDVFDVMLSEMWSGASCGIPLLCCRSSDYITGGPSAHSDQSLWFERVRVLPLPQLLHRHITRVSIFFLFVFQTRKRNFGISYLSRDWSGAEMYLSLLSDGDLDAAFVSSAKPVLQLKMDIKPSEESKTSSVSPKQASGTKRSTIKYNR